MSNAIRPNRLGRWLRRHSLTLVAALGGAAGVAYAAGWHGQPDKHVTSTTHHVVTVSNQKPAELPRDNVQDTVQIALVLDTSGSMDGLINQARSHLWTMVDQMGRMTRVVNGKTRGVRIELALYEYGNDTIPADAGFIRQVMPFTHDLDKVSEKLHALFTNGGSEFAGQAITTVVKDLQWSSDPDAMKFVFVAGNEEFDQGPITAANAMKVAAGKDVNVQLIFCGDEDPTWRAAAKLAKSDLLRIDQNQVARHIPAPQDDQILQLGQQLNSTYVAWGADGTASLERQREQDQSSARLSKKVAIERAQLKSKQMSYDNSGWDIVDATRNDGDFFIKNDDAQLPAEFRGKSLEEKKALAAKYTAERAELQAKIAKLEQERTTFLDAERKRQNLAAENSLETELMKSTKTIAAKKGYK
jgi:von Willebrand factor type A domain